jgi:hypothetical protein
MVFTEIIFFWACIVLLIFCTCLLAILVARIIIKKDNERH